MPSGKKNTVTMKNAPTIRSHSTSRKSLMIALSRLTSTAPTNAPTSVPRPPTATQTMTSVEKFRPKSGGETKPEK